VNPQRSIRNIALIGFMGSGKSSVGRLVAELLGFEFVDTDALIETRAGCPISTIFAQQGEPAFRELEAATVRELAGLNQVVIATGGGLPTNPANLDSLRTHALVACLWSSPERLYERVRHQTHRPLLQVPDPLERIRTLLEQRTPCYREADVMIGTEGRGQREIAQQVITQFRLATHGQA
jgi:shikimate kinase